MDCMCIPCQRPPVHIVFLCVSYIKKSYFYKLQIFRQLPFMQYKCAITNRPAAQKKKPNVNTCKYVNCHQKCPIVNKQSFETVSVSCWVVVWHVYMRDGGGVTFPLWASVRNTNWRWPSACRLLIRVTVMSTVQLKALLRSWDAWSCLRCQTTSTRWQRSTSSCSEFSTWGKGTVWLWHHWVRLRELDLIKAGRTAMQGSRK